MSGDLALVLIDTSTQGAAEALGAAVSTADAVLVHPADVEFADGAPRRLVRYLRRPHRRLVRVYTGGGFCYIARTDLLATALRHGVTTSMLVSDPPGLDREIALAVDAAGLAVRTPIEDPASGRWRQWVDGSVIGVRALADEDPGWSQRTAREHGTVATATTLLRRHAGRARRDFLRLRQRS